MTGSLRTLLILAAVVASAIGLPFLLPDFKIQLALMWVMIVFALTWDLGGGQMGYN